MIALEGNFAYSFILGVMAAVNPCGFVLLPTYLVYYLGTELGRHDDNAGRTLQRGLLVGASVSTGFVALFFVVGLISEMFTKAIENNAKYVSLLIGIALVAMGIGMLLGWKPPVAQPDVSINRERTLVNMFLFGIVYAIASLGCTIGFLTSVIFGSVGRHGYFSAVISMLLYALGMGLLVTSLTVALAFARVGFVSFLKKGLRWFDRVSGVFVLFTGMYLTWYWYAAIADRGSDALISRVESWQSRVAEFLSNAGSGILAAVFVAVIGLAAFLSRRGSRSA